MLFSAALCISTNDSMDFQARNWSRLGRGQRAREKSGAPTSLEGLELWSDVVFMNNNSWKEKGRECCIERMATPPCPPHSALPINFHAAAITENRNLLQEAADNIV